MSTTVLAYLILMMGFLTFLAGLWGVLILIFEEVGKTEPVPFRYYAIMVGLISGGLAMIGIGQGLSHAKLRWRRSPRAGDGNRPAPFLARPLARSAGWLYGEKLRKFLVSATFRCGLNTRRASVEA
jgi:hypothetical protein